MRRFGSILALGALAACAARPSSCPDDLPASCPTSGAPSYQATVAAIIADKCDTCHAPGGLDSSLPLTTYNEVFTNRRTVLDQVYNCLMPNTGAGGVALTADERAALLAWLVCGSPDN